MSIIPLRPQSPPERDGFDEFMDWVKFFGDNISYQSEVDAYKKVVEEYRELYGVYDTYAKALEFKNKAEASAAGAEQAHSEARIVKGDVFGERDKLVAEGEAFVQKLREDARAETDDLLKQAQLKLDEANILKNRMDDERRVFLERAEASEQLLAKRDHDLKDDEDKLKQRKEQIANREKRLSDIIDRYGKEITLL